MAKKKTAEKTVEKKEAAPLNLQPLGDRVVIERESAEEVTAGGLVLPDTAKDKPSRGTIIATGEGRLMKNGNRVPLQVQVGDRVIFSAYAVDEFKLGDRQLLLAREEDILAVIS